MRDGGGFERLAGLCLALLVLSITAAPHLAMADDVREVVRQFDPATGRWVRRERSLSFQSSWNRSPVEPELVSYPNDLPAGTIVIDTQRRRLFHIRDEATAVRYGVGVGREGFAWRGRERISRKAEWPDWRPPAEMIEREAANGRILPSHMEGGPDNPLGARALYLGSTLFRIHGTNQPWTIGQAVSSGCIRMANNDIVELYEKVEVGDLVVVK